VRSVITFPVQSERQQRYLNALREFSHPPQAAVEAEVASMRGLSPTARGERLVAVSRAAWAVLRSRPDFRQAVVYSDPLPGDFAAKWSALLARRRAQQRASHGPC
jgi:hypothetical protein